MKKLFVFLFLLTNTLVSSSEYNWRYVKVLPEVTVTATRIYKLSRVTVYNPEENQTDDTPNITACGGIINVDDPLSHRWIALSRDMLKLFPYGTKVKITGTGKYDGVWTVMDTMNKRYTKSADFLTHEKRGKWHDVKIQKA